MDEQEKQLCYLLDALQQHPKNSTEWRRIMHRLLVFLQSLPEFNKYVQPGRPAYFLEALNLTWEWVCREIHTFQPRSDSRRKDIVRWINGYLYWRVRDLSVKAGKSERSLDEPLPNNDNDEMTTWLDRVLASGELAGKNFQPPPLSGLTVYIEKQQAKALQDCALKLELYIETDPDDKLRKSHPRNFPNCNSQLLAQRMLLKHPPDKLSEISREFTINYQVLNSHWKRKTLPLLRELAIQFGYSNPELP
jgi:hypothetical protein